MSNDIKCVACRYFVPLSLFEKGECHRHAPIPASVMPRSVVDHTTRDALARWPVVTERQWCGEFTPEHRVNDTAMRSWCTCGPAANVHRDDCPVAIHYRAARDALRAQGADDAGKWKAKFDKLAATLNRLLDVLAASSPQWKQMIEQARKDADAGT